MNQIRESLQYGPHERIVSVIPDRIEDKRLNWEGRGALQIIQSEYIYRSSARLDLSLVILL